VRYEQAGGVAKEFNTIGSTPGSRWPCGMLYSLPSRELIADSVEYMVNAHCADAWSASQLRQDTPGMLMAALRLNIPACSSRAADGGRQSHTPGQTKALT